MDTFKSDLSPDNSATNAQFNELMQREFPDGIESTESDTTDEQVSTKLTQETVGSDAAIARAHIEELRELVSKNLAKQAYLQMELDARVNERLTSELTAMPNREAFMGWLDKELATADTSKLTVGFLDMDNLKSINDTYGHELADTIIRRIGAILSSNVREQADMIAAHRSGDEFLIGINGATPERVSELAHSVLEMVNQLYIQKNSDGTAKIIERDKNDQSTATDDLRQVNISMGFARMHEGMSATGLLDAADNAMYQAKKDGRNRIVISEDTMQVYKIGTAQQFRFY